MQYKIEKSPQYSLASITEAESQIVSAIISIDVHQDRLVTTQALEHVYPDVLLSGAGKYTRAEFLDAVNMLGADLGIVVSNSVFTMTLRSVVGNFSKLLKLVEVMLLEPHVSKSELERIRSTVVNGLEQSKEDSSGIAHENLLNTIYGESDRRYSYDIDADIAEVKVIKPAQVKALHAAVLQQFWVSSIAGEDKVVELFEKFLKRLKKTQALPTVLKSLHQQKPPKSLVVLKDIPSKQNIDFSIGAPISFTLHHPDYTALMFGIAVLGKWGGFTGRLMSTVREKEGLTYGIYSGLEGFSLEEQGSWRIKTFFAPDKTLQGVTSTFREIKKMYKKGVTAEEFAKFKVILSTGQVLLQDSVTSLLRDLHAYHFKGFTLAEMQTHKEKINSLTLEDVNKAVKTYLDPATLTVSGAGPIKSVKEDINKFIKELT